MCITYSLFNIVFYVSDDSDVDSEGDWHGFGGPLAQCGVA